MISALNASSASWACEEDAAWADAAEDAASAIGAEEFAVSGEALAADELPVSLSTCLHQSAKSMYTHRGDHGTTHSTSVTRDTPLDSARALQLVHRCSNLLSEIADYPVQTLKA